MDDYAYTSNYAIDVPIEVKVCLKPIRPVLPIGYCL